MDVDKKDTIDIGNEQYLRTYETKGTAATGMMKNSVPAIAFELGHYDKDENGNTTEIKDFTGLYDFGHVRVEFGLTEHKNGRVRVGEDAFSRIGEWLKDTGSSLSEENLIKDYLNPALEEKCEAGLGMMAGGKLMHATIQPFSADAPVSKNPIAGIISKDDALSIRAAIPDENKGTPSIDVSMEGNAGDNILLHYTLGSEGYMLQSADTEGEKNILPEDIAGRLDEIVSSNSKFANFKDFEESRIQAAIGTISERGVEGTFNGQDAVFYTHSPGSVSLRHGCGSADAAIFLKKTDGSDRDPQVFREQASRLADGSTRIARSYGDGGPRAYLVASYREMEGGRDVSIERIVDGDGNHYDPGKAEELVKEKSGIDLSFGMTGEYQGKVSQELSRVETAKEIESRQSEPKLEKAIGICRTAVQRLDNPTDEKETPSYLYDILMNATGEIENSIKEADGGRLDTYKIFLTAAEGGAKREGDFTKAIKDIGLSDKAIAFVYKTAAALDLESDTKEHFCSLSSRAAFDYIQGAKSRLEKAVAPMLENGKLNEKLGAEDKEYAISAMKEYADDIDKFFADKTDTDGQSLSNADIILGRSDEGKAVAEVLEKAGQKAIAEGSDDITYDSRERIAESGSRNAAPFKLDKRGKVEPAWRYFKINRDGVVYTPRLTKIDGSRVETSDQKELSFASRNVVQYFKTVSIDIKADGKAEDLIKGPDAEKNSRQLQDEFKTEHSGTAGWLDTAVAAAVEKKILPEKGIEKQESPILDRAEEELKDFESFNKAINDTEPAYLPIEQYLPVMEQVVKEGEAKEKAVDTKSLSEDEKGERKPLAQVWEQQEFKDTDSEKEIYYKRVYNDSVSVRNKFIGVSPVMGTYKSFGGYVINNYRAVIAAYKGGLPINDGIGRTYYPTAYDVISAFDSLLRYNPVDELYIRVVAAIIENGHNSTDKVEKTADSEALLDDRTPEPLPRPYKVETTEDGSDGENVIKEQPQTVADEKQETIENSTENGPEKPEETQERTSEGAADKGEDTAYDEPPEDAVEETESEKNSPLDTDPHESETDETDETVKETDSAETPSESVDVDTSSQKEGPEGNEEVDRESPGNTDENPVEKTRGGESFYENTDEKTVDETSVDETTVDKPPADETPADEAPTDKETPGETSVDETSADKTPTDETREEVAPINEETVESTDHPETEEISEDGRSSEDTDKAIEDKIPVDSESSLDTDKVQEDGASVDERHDEDTDNHPADDTRMDKEDSENVESSSAADHDGEEDPSENTDDGQTEKEVVDEALPGNDEADGNSDENVSEETGESAEKLIHEGNEKAETTESIEENSPDSEQEQNEGADDSDSGSWNSWNKSEEDGDETIFSTDPGMTLNTVLNPAILKELGFSVSQETESETKGTVIQNEMKENDGADPAVIAESGRAARPNAESHQDTGTDFESHQTDAGERRQGESHSISDQIESAVGDYLDNGLMEIRDLFDSKLDTGDGSVSIRDYCFSGEYEQGAKNFGDAVAARIEAAGIDTFAADNGEPDGLTSKMVNILSHAMDFGDAGMEAIGQVESALDPAFSGIFEDMLDQTPSTYVVEGEPPEVPDSATDDVCQHMQTMVDQTAPDNSDFDTWGGAFDNPESEFYTPDPTDQSSVQSVEAMGVDATAQGMEAQANVDTAADADFHGMHDFEMGENDAGSAVESPQTGIDSAMDMMQAGNDAIEQTQAMQAEVAEATDVEVHQDAGGQDMTDYPEQDTSVDGAQLDGQRDQTVDTDNYDDGVDSIDSVDN